MSIPVLLQDFPKAEGGSRPLLDTLDTSLRVKEISHRLHTHPTCGRQGLPAGHHVPAPRTHMARARYAGKGQVQVSSPYTGRVFSRRCPQGDGPVEAWNGVSSPWSLGCGLQPVSHPGELLVRLGLPSSQGPDPDPDTQPGCGCTGHMWRVPAKPPSSQLCT